MQGENLTRMALVTDQMKVKKTKNLLRKQACDQRKQYRGNHDVLLNVAKSMMEQMNGQAPHLCTLFCRTCSSHIGLPVPKENSRLATGTIPHAHTACFSHEIYNT
jgi:hypothetical protein